MNGLSGLKGKVIDKVSQLSKGNFYTYIEFKDGSSIYINDYHDTWESSYIYAIEGNVRKLRGATILDFYKSEQDPYIEVDCDPCTFVIVTDKGIYKVCYLGEHQGQVDGSSKLIKYQTKEQRELSDCCLEYGVVLDY